MHDLGAFGTGARHETACWKNTFIGRPARKKISRTDRFYPVHAGSSIRAGTKGRFLGGIASFVEDYRS